jgi:hypothetical protein
MYIVNRCLLLSLLVYGFLLESCIPKEDLCERTEITKQPSEDQLSRFGYFRHKKDTFLIEEYGEMDTAFTAFNFPQQGNELYVECLEQPKGCVCTKSLYYYKVYITCRAKAPNQFAYGITYDYIHDSVEFYMPVWGMAKIAGKDLRNGNAKTYIGNYMHKNKLYTHVHKLEVNYADRFEAYVNDSVGVIYYKYRDIYVAERL